MRKLFFISAFSLLSSLSFAQDLDCQIAYNSETILTNKITAVPGEKVLIGKTSSAMAYLTLNKGLYTVEAFLPEYEARIYGQGALTQDTDVVTASLWGRESMIDVTCRLVK